MKKFYKSQCSRFNFFYDLQPCFNNCQLLPLQCFQDNDGLIRALALAVQRNKDIHVISIAPGFIVTEGGEEWFNAFSDPKKKREKIIEIHPVRKLGTVEEVGALCAFLCSSYASFISGSTYLIDGGRSAVMQDI